MRPRHSCRLSPHTLRGPIESSAEGPKGCGHMRPRHPMSAHPSHGSWPQRKPHRMPLHASQALISAHPSHGSSHSLAVLAAANGWVLRQASYFLFPPPVQPLDMVLRR
eukprot:85538-Pyramimonas_sp.AAC.1